MINDSRKFFAYNFLIISFLALLFISDNAWSQVVAYSQSDKNETKSTNFDIIGRYGDKLLVFKHNRSTSYISVYDANMNLVENVDLPFMPQRVLEYDFLPFSDHSFLFYQYQQRNVAFLMAVKIGADGKPVTTPLELDTTHINYNASKRVYSVITSEDKSRFMAFKINSRNEKKLVFETKLFTSNLESIHASRLELVMNDDYDFLTDFYLDNQGALVFGKGRRRSSEENISQFYLVSKAAKADTFQLRELEYEGISLDEVKLRIDNTNKRYLFTAFYYKGRRNGNIEGVVNAMFDQAADGWTVKNIIPLNDELRADARSDNNLKTAFNDYYIRQIFIRKDGGFIMNAESIYTTSRGGSPFNRWDMFGNPWMLGSPMGWGGWGMAGPGMWGSPYWGGGQWGNNATRYHADNVMVLIFDKDGRLSMSNIIHKSQFDDQSEAMVSYQTINTGSLVHFLYNNYDKRDVILASQSLDSDGKVTRNPTMRGVDPKYNFMPRYARQISSRTVIVPCLMRNYLCFARIDF